MSQLGLASLLKNQVVQRNVVRDGYKNQSGDIQDGSPAMIFQRNVVRDGMVIRTNQETAKMAAHQ